MKPQYYVYVVLAIILIIIATVLYKGQPSAESQVVTACIESGGTYNVGTKSCTPPSKSGVKATPAPVTQTGSQPKPTSYTTPAKPASGYYQIHLSAGGPDVYYSSSTTVPDMIKVYNPTTNTTVTSPLSVTGLARGPWYFEADAPMLLTDAKGKILARGHVTAQSNWMTNEMVPFLGSIAFPRQTTGSYGVLVLQKSNASDLSQNDASIEIRVTFK